MRNDFGTCIVCGGECPCCTSTTGWRKVACSIEHYELFLTLREYQAGRMSAMEAFEKSKELCAEYESLLLPAVQAVLDRMAAEAQSEDTVQSPLEEETTQETAQEGKVSQPFARSRVKRHIK